MTRVLVWKELREQWAVWLILALAGLGGALTIDRLVGPGNDKTELLAGVLLATVWAYGLVCGALQLAGEREDGTQAFLDALPGTRSRLWHVKVLTGVGLLAAQTAALGAVGFALVRFSGAPLAAAFVGGLAYAAVLGYAWGLLCGTTAPSVLGAVGRALVAQAASYIGVVLPLVAVLKWFGLLAQTIGLQTFLVVAGFLLAFGAAVGSRFVYANPDRLRWLAAAALAPATFGALLHAARRRAAPLFLGMLCIALLGTIPLAITGAAAWPLLSLLVGAACGATAFADGRRTWTDDAPHVPRGAASRVWLVRIGVHLAIAVVALLVLLFTSATVFVAIENYTGRMRPVSPFGVRILAPDAEVGMLAQPGLFLAIWIVYGFAAGQLAGLLFRKPFVAAGAAFAGGAILVALWVPSLVVGALHGWQVCGAPALLLVAGRLLAPWWAAGRPTALRELGGPAAALLLAACWTAGALAYRVLEVPDGPALSEVEAFAASLPPPEANEGGRLTLAACRRLTQLEQQMAVQVQRRLPVPPSQPDSPLLALRPFASPATVYIVQAFAVAEDGWAASNPRLAAWLDLLFADEWAKQMAEAANLPVGIAEDPRNNAVFTVLPHLQTASHIGAMFVARGLQQQAAGQPAGFVEQLRVGLALVRNLRYKTSPVSVLVARRIETTLLRGIEPWLAHLGNRPDLLAQVLAVLREHEADPQPDPAETLLALDLAYLNAVDRLPEMARQVPLSNSTLIGREIDKDLVVFAVQVPWEHARLRRQVLCLTPGRIAEDSLAVELSRVTPLLKNLAGGGQLPTLSPRRSECLLRGALLQVALRLYRTEVGQLPETLDALAPKYLAAVPTDPFADRPFRYRISQGERLRWPRPIPEESRSVLSVLPAAPLQFRDVPAGWGIVWSVGEDGRDDGGILQASRNSAESKPGEDIIFLVPPPTQR